MAGKELTVRRRSLPAEMRRSLFVDWYAGREGVQFEIYAGDPTRYLKSNLEGIKHIAGLKNVVLNTDSLSGELIIVGVLAADYRRKASKIEQVLLKITRLLLEIEFRYIAYIPGSGMKEFTLKGWANLTD